jgi:hypothetical protein
VDGYSLHEQEKLVLQVSKIGGVDECKRGKGLGEARGRG